MELVKHRFSTRQVTPHNGANAWRERIIEMNYMLEFRSNPKRPYRGAFKRLMTPTYQLVVFAGERAEYIREHAHVSADKLDDFEIFAVNRGHCTVEQFGSSSKCTAGSIFMIDASAPFLFAHSDAFSGAIFKVPRRLILGQFSDFDLVCGRSIACVSGVPRISLDLLSAIERESLSLDFAGFEDICRKLLDLFCTTIESSSLRPTIGSPPSAQIASRARRYIRQSIANENLSTRDIARAAGVSTRYLQKLFQSRGTTVQSYIQTQRLDHARRLLGGQGCRFWPITRIAYESGYSSGAYFSTAFKKVYGLSPSAYRLQAGGGNAQ